MCRVEVVVVVSEMMMMMVDADTIIMVHVLSLTHTRRHMIRSYIFVNKCVEYTVDGTGGSPSYPLQW